MPAVRGAYGEGDTRMPGLTVLVPCFNEGEVIRRTHAEISAALAGLDDLEILLVDDGSRDHTLAELKALAAADPRVRYLSFSRNFGLAAAVTAGFRYASRPWIAQVDSDLQNPPEEIWKLLAKAAEGYDVVFGTREHRRDPLPRRWGSAAAHWLARRGLGIEVPSGASSFRVLRTGVARTLADLRLGGPYFVAMVPLIGARYACVPTAHRPRPGRSRFRVARLTGHAFELFFGYSWRPLNAGYLLAAAGVLAGVALAGLGAAGVAGPAATGVGALLVSAGTLATVAVVGRYLHRLMLDQRPTRPYYVREANVAVRPEDRFDGGEDPVPPPAARPPLLVLGAGEEQIPVYVEAKRRGLRTIAVDRWTDRPALRHADEHLHLSTRYPGPIAAALGHRRLSGVVTAASDVALASWHELAGRYGAPYRFPAAAVRASADKAAFHAVAEAAGVDRYRWRRHTDPAALVALAGEVGFPLVAKPADASGSKGVTLVPEAAQLPAALEYAARFTAGGELLIEEFLPGRNLTVDVFMRAGRAAFTGITEKRIQPGPHFVIGGHTCPAPVDAATRTRLEETAVRLCRAVDLHDGPANFDVILGPDGRVRVLEANVRLCGNAVPQLMREVYGVDTVAALVSLAIGEPFELAPTPPRAGIIHLLASPLATDGVLTDIAGLDAVRALPGVVRCELYAEPGATVRPFTEGGHKFGYLLVAGPDVDTAEATLATALTVLRITVRPVPAPPAPRQPVEGVSHAVN
jgi:biotin carboxylase